MSWKTTIEELRKTLSVRQIATHVGISVQAVYQIENEEISPKASTAGALERLLKREKAVQKTRERFDEKHATAVKDDAA